MRKLFIKWHLYALFFSMAFLVVQLLLARLRPFLDISIYAMLLFSTFALAIYFISMKFINHRNKFLFGNIILISTFVKILLSMATIFTYYYLKAPVSKLFVFPFLVVYLIFTIFETIFLVQINTIGSGRK
jgi:hypothetical protein